jgi:hypothetical protein
MIFTHPHALDEVEKQQLPLMPFLDLSRVFQRH